jgi:methyltransferase
VAGLAAPPTLPLLAAVLALLGAERLGELALNRRNSRWLAQRGAVWHGADGFGLILAGQVLLFVSTAAEAAFAPWSGTGWWTWPLLGLALLAQALRYWCITTLGPRWCIRVVTLPGAPRVDRGPYRWFPHPNYAAVLLEAIAIPLAFGALATALVLVPLKLVALRRRIRIEERALEAASGADRATTPADA